MAFIGIRMSWLMLNKKRVFASFALFPDKLSAAVRPHTLFPDVFSSEIEKNRNDQDGKKP